MAVAHLPAHETGDLEVAKGQREGPWRRRWAGDVVPEAAPQLAEALGTTEEGGEHREAPLARAEFSRRCLLRLRQQTPGGGRKLRAPGREKVLRTKRMPVAGMAFESPRFDQSGDGVAERLTARRNRGLEFGKANTGPANERGENREGPPVMGQVGEVDETRFDGSTSS